MERRGRIRHDHRRPGARAGAPLRRPGRGSRSCRTARAPRNRGPGMPRMHGHTDWRTPPKARNGAEFTIGYAGHLYPWKGVDLVIEAVAALPDTRGLIVGGTREGAGPGAGEGVGGGVELRVAGHVHRADSAGGCRGAAARGGRADAAEPGVGDLERVHLAAEAVRVHGVGTADRRQRPAVAARGAPATGRTRCWSSRATRRR